jgi:hypothetical protein
MCSFLHYILDALIAHADGGVVASRLRTADLELQHICLGLLVVTQCIQLSYTYC